MRLTRREALASLITTAFATATGGQNLENVQSTPIRMLPGGRFQFEIMIPHEALSYSTPWIKQVLLFDVLYERAFVPIPEFGVSLLPESAYNLLLIQGHLNEIVDDATKEFLNLEFHVDRNVLVTRGGVFLKK